MSLKFLAPEHCCNFQWKETALADISGSIQSIDT